MGVKWAEEWAEAGVLLFMVLGFVLSIFLTVPVLSYFSVIIAGFLAGRIYFIKRYTEPIFPLILIICGFLLGYLLGGIWISRALVIFLFLVSLMGSYYLHLKKILVIFKSQNFIK
ncbi:MAG: hypothetical protein WCV90_04005 [Candidatus Woesearchaeota archaeon]